MTPNLADASHLEIRAMYRMLGSSLGGQTHLPVSRAHMQPHRAGGCLIKPAPRSANDLADPPGIQKVERAASRQVGSPGPPLAHEVRVKAKIKSEGMVNLSNAHLG